MAFQTCVRARRYACKSRLHHPRSLDAPRTHCATEQCSLTSELRTACSAAVVPTVRIQTTVQYRPVLSRTNRMPCETKQTSCKDIDIKSAFIERCSAVKWIGCIRACTGAQRLTEVTFLIESATQYAVNRRSATAINRYSTQILEVLPIINYCRTSNSYKTIQYQKQYRYQNQYLESIICTAGMNDIEPPTAECTGTGVAERELHHSHACVWCHCHWAPVQ